MLILASASPRRLQLLASIGIAPGQVIPADIDETPLKRESPLDYVRRVARGKAERITSLHPTATILAADTVVAVGKHILPKAEDADTARACLKLLSNKRHRVLTHVCVVKEGIVHEQTVETLVRFTYLSPEEIERYIASGEWDGKAGGYAIQGLAASYIALMRGSHSNVVGLPLYETRRLLRKVSGE